MTVCVRSGATPIPFRSFAPAAAGSTPAAANRNFLLAIKSRSHCTRWNQALRSGSAGKSDDPHTIPFCGLQLDDAPQPKRPRASAQSRLGCNRGGRRRRFFPVCLGSIKAGHMATCRHAVQQRRSGKCRGDHDRELTGSGLRQVPVDRRPRKQKPRIRRAQQDRIAQERRTKDRKPWHPTRGPAVHLKVSRAWPQR